MAARYEIKVKISDELKGMDFQQLVERAAEHPGGAEYAEKMTNQVNRTSCNGCTLNANMAALRVWIAKREMQGEERKGEE